MNIDSENPLYLIFNNVDGYSKEGNKFSRRQQVLSTSLFTRMCV